ncbi:MAG: FecR domain-containing protein [Thermodesulfobacteriota bacterium]
MKTMTTRVIGGTLVLALLIFGYHLQVSGQSANPVLVVVKLKGVVQVKSAGADSWRPAEIDLKLSPGDFIRTGPDGKAMFKLLLELENELYLYANTEMQVSDFIKNTQNAPISANIRLLKGGAWAKINTIKDSNLKFNVTTPNAVAAISGTSLAVSVWDGDQSYFCACHGTIDVKNPAGAVVINKAEGTHVAAAAPPSVPKSEKNLLMTLKNPADRKLGMCLYCHTSIDGCAYQTDIKF